MADSIYWTMYARPGSKVMHLADVSRSNRRKDDQLTIVVQCGRDITYSRTNMYDINSPYVPNSRHGDYDVCRSCVANLRRYLQQAAELLEVVEGWS